MSSDKKLEEEVLVVEVSVYLLGFPIIQHLKIYTNG